MTFARSDPCSLKEVAVYATELLWVQNLYIHRTKFSLTTIKDVPALVSELTGVNTTRASVAIVNLLTQTQSPS